jgi:hypothetical protein
LLRDEAEREERVRDLLLVSDHALGDRLDAVGLPLERDFNDGNGKPDRRCKLLGDGMDVTLGPVVDFAELSQY